MKRHHRSLLEKWFRILCATSTVLSALVLAILIISILIQGAQWLDFQFLNSFPSRFPEKAGIKSALWGTLWLMGLTALISIPLGISSAVYLEEYAPKNRLTRFIQVNISNLAGVPSIVYGLLGLAVFVRFFHLGRSIWAGSLTLSLLILPIIIISSQESLRSIPDSLRQGAFAMGARRSHTVFGQVLPAALPGIMTGIILALSRAIGETAPLIMIGALSYVAFVPEGPMDQFTSLPIQIFNWASRPQKDFHGLAAAAILVLLATLFTMNFIAVTLRHASSRKHQW